MTCPECEAFKTREAAIAAETDLIKKGNLEFHEIHNAFEAVDRNRRKGMPCKGCLERAELLKQVVGAVKHGKMTAASEKMWKALKSAGKDALAMAYRAQFEDDEPSPKS